MFSIMCYADSKDVNIFPILQAYYKFTLLTEDMFEH